MAVKEEKCPINAMTDAIPKGDKEFDKEVTGSLFAVVGLINPFILVVVLAQVLDLRRHRKSEIFHHLVEAT